MTGRANATEVLPPEIRVVVSQQGTTSTIQVAGEWDPAAHELTRRAVAETLGHEPESLILDLSAVTSMDAGGVALVVALARRCTCQGVRLVIFPGPDEVQRAFRTGEVTQGLPFVVGP